MWTVTFGSHEATFRVAQKRGKPTPLDTKPMLVFSLEKYMEAFLDLSSSRSTYFVTTDKKSLLLPNPIQFCEIESWLRLYSIPKADWSDFVYLITALDAAYIDLAKSKLDGNTSDHH